MTKKEARARKNDWMRAVAEGRVVRLNGGMQMTSYPTVAAAQAAQTELSAQGLDAEIVKL